MRCWRRRAGQLRRPRGDESRSSRAQDLDNLPARRAAARRRRARLRTARARSARRRRAPSSTAPPSRRPEQAGVARLSASEATCGTLGARLEASRRRRAGRDFGERQAVVQLRDRERAPQRVFDALHVAHALGHSATPSRSSKPLKVEASWPLFDGARGLPHRARGGDYLRRTRFDGLGHRRSAASAARGGSGASRRDAASSAAQARDFVPSPVSMPSYHTTHPSHAFERPGARLRGALRNPMLSRDQHPRLAARSPRQHLVLTSAPDADA